MVKLKARYPSALLCVIAFVSFIGWLWTKLILVNVALDQKYLESEDAEIHERAMHWAQVRSCFGWVLFISLGLLALILFYRWFIHPSQQR